MPALLQGIREAISPANRIATNGELVIQGKREPGAKVGAGSGRDV